MATTAAIIGAAAAVASAGTGIAASAGAFGGGTAPKVPQTQNLNDLLKRVLPADKANSASQVGGGMSPEFLAGVVGDNAGFPGSGLDIIADIQKSLGGVGSGTSTGITA